MKWLQKTRLQITPIIILIMLGSPSLHAEPKRHEIPLASPMDMETARNVLEEWTEAYKNRKFSQQWRLTDYRIRRWHDKKRWWGWMRRASRRSGKLVSYSIDRIVPLHATQVPCTEQGHCFRKDVQVIIITIKSRYEKAKPPQPEYVVMAKSPEGWRFGGGTFPNRPLGETAVILDRKDEARYRPDLNLIQRQ